MQVSFPQMVPINPQASEFSSLLDRLSKFVAPLLERLDAIIDKRLVQTFARTLVVLLGFGDRLHGLLLSELGAYLCSPEHAPAGTKRLSNLLRSDKWSHDLIDAFLWEQADQRQKDLASAGEDTLLLWDGSVVEKHESRKIEDLCPVRSEKAKRLTRNRPGFSGGPPGKPTFVPGYHWLGLLIAGRKEAPALAAMRWFSSRGENATTEREVVRSLMTKAWAAWGRNALHIFDRGFAGGPWVKEMYDLGARFILRWPKRYKLLNSRRQKVAAWQVTRGKRSWEQRLVRDAHTGKFYEDGIIAEPVWHPDLPDTPLWLVVSRPKQGREPWYLLTNEPITDAEAAWRVIFAYARRWQIEMAFRYYKTELAMESPRVWTLERRTKLMLMLSVLYAFLLTLLDQSLEQFRTELLNHFCKTNRKAEPTNGGSALQNPVGLYPHDEPPNGRTLSRSKSGMTHGGLHRSYASKNGQVSL